MGGGQGVGSSARDVRCLKLLCVRKEAGSREEGEEKKRKEGKEKKRKKGKNMIFFSKFENF
jgi:hypothetical protein